MSGSIPVNIQHIRSSLRTAIYEGIFAQSFAILSGSIFLPAYAIVLGADPFQIGVLASIPFFANTMQLFGAFLIERFYRRKELVILSASIARSIWIPLIIISFLMAEDNPKMVLYGLLLIFISYQIFAALSGISWLTWMSLLVPDPIRGRYFGLRNSVLAMVTIMMTLIGSYFLDVYPKIFPDLPENHAFEIIFSAAVIFSFISIYLLSRQEDIKIPLRSQRRVNQLFLAPFKNKSFIKIIRFAVLWSFAVGFAAPFFIVYMIEELKISYTLIGIYTIISAVADLGGMWFWGNLSDKMGNRPIIILNSFIAASLPFLWIFTVSESFSVYFFIPFLHMIGGFVWAGYNLCSTNLLIRITPVRGNSVYFAFWNIINGVSAGIGALAGGFVANATADFFSPTAQPLDSIFKIVFLLSAIMRLLSLILVRSLEETQGLPLIKVVRILRSLRTWTSMMGFHPLLSYFLPARSGENEKAQQFWPLWSRKEEDREI